MNTAIALTSEDALKMGQGLSGSKSFGPLTISYNIDLIVPQITATAKIYGVSVGQVLIDTSHPTATLGGNIGIAEAEAVLNVDFNKNELDYQVKVSVLDKNIYSGKGTLFSW